MNEINQIKKLMETVDEAYGKEGTPYQNYKPEEANDQYDPKTGKWSRSGQYDDPPFIQAHNLSDDSIFDAYVAGKISYEEAAAQLKQIHKDPGDMEMAMNTLDTYYGDTEVEWDEESGGGIVRERQSIVHEPDAFDLELTADDVTVYTHGGEPVFAMPIDDWMALISKFNRNYRP